METEITIIGHYNSPTEAYLDATLLRDNEIECVVDGDELINAMPLAGGQVTLSVLSSNAARARELLHSNE